MLHHRAKSFLHAAAIVVLIVGATMSDLLAQTQQRLTDIQSQTPASRGQQNSSASASASSRISVRLKATLVGHTKSIVEIAFSPDGETLATGSEDGTVRLWNARTGELKATLTGADKYKWVTIVWSPDGRTIAVRGTRTYGDEKIQVWDVRAGKMKAVFGTDKDSGLTWSPDGRMLLTTTLERFVKLWDAETGSLRATLEQDPPCPKQSFWKSWGSDNTCTDFSDPQGSFDADGQTVLTTSWYHSSKLWDAATGKLKTTLPIKEEREGDFIYPYPALLSPDRRLVVRNDRDGAALLDTTTGQVRYTLGQIGQPLAFSPDGQKLLVVLREPKIKLRGGEDELKLYDIESGQLRLTFEKVPEGVDEIYWSPDGGNIVMVGEESTNTRLLDTRTGRVKARLPYGGCTHDVWWGSGGCESFIFSADGRVMLKQKNPLKLWSAETGELLTTLDATDSFARFSPTDKHLLVTRAKDKKKLLLWEISLQ